MLSKPRLTPKERDYQIAAKALSRRLCTCGHAKQTGMAFCFKCWGSVPTSMRKALYRPLGDGFEAAYSAARHYLASIRKEVNTP